MSMRAFRNLIIGGLVAAFGLTAGLTSSTAAFAQSRTGTSSTEHKKAATGKHHRAKAKKHTQKKHHKANKKATKKHHASQAKKHTKSAHQPQ